MIAGRQSPSVSAQSPPCRRNRFPSCASVTSAFSRSISHDVTSGGRLWSFSTTPATSSASSYRTACAAFFDFQESGDQVIRRRVYGRPPTMSEDAASLRRVIAAASLGTLFEWYDFYLYGSLAVFFGGLF